MPAYQFYEMIPKNYVMRIRKLITAMSNKQFKYILSLFYVILVENEHFRF